ncbi:F0F1 ATP synthase assembly protein I [Brevundimonas naejangsanensis]|uniref:ATP synthase protein I n=1 Tax=Brevundimonas naejangsanensis TaxID=588932 RepID=A0A494RCS7_9CAUL|nr:AtpZ/AtpI family protein [Brevundimonas naejangsanensis]AYG94095.1 F0F1 ATP synthase assembly protein I [Brevundimonas naejangsanensis]
MSPTKESREEAIKRLNKSASALEARTQADKSAEVAAQKVVGQAYRIIAELLGGVAIGLAFGFGVDRLFGTTPMGVVGGVLLGFALSIYMARRTANRLMAQAKAAGLPQQGEPIIEADDEDRER